MSALQWTRGADFLVALLVAFAVWLTLWLLAPRGANAPQVVGRWLRNLLADVRWGWGLL